MLNRLKNDNFKLFLYKFFILWNFIVIILLVLLNIKIKKEKKSFYKIKSYGQIKLLWNNRFKYNDKYFSVTKFTLTRLSSDNIYDVVSLSSNNFVTGLNGKNGEIIFSFQSPSAINNILSGKHNFIIGSQNGVIALYKSGNKIWERNLKNKLKYLSRINDYIIIYMMNSIFKIRELNGKVYKKIQLRDNIYSKVDSVDINNDKINDIIISSREYIDCRDGKTLNLLWRVNITNSYLFNGIRLKNKRVRIILNSNKSNIIILNKYGFIVGKIPINGNLKYILFPRYKRERYLLIGSDKIISLYNLLNLNKEWEMEKENYILNIKDLDYNGDDEIIVVNKITGEGFILNTGNSRILDKFLFYGNKGNITTDLKIFDIDNDSNLEFMFGNKDGYISVYKYITFHKNLLKLILKRI